MGFLGNRKYLLLVTTALLFTPAPLLAEFTKAQSTDADQGDGIVIRTQNKTHWVVIHVGTNKQLSKYMVDMGADNLGMIIVSHRHYSRHVEMDNAIKARFPNPLLTIGINKWTEDGV